MPKRRRNRKIPHARRTCIRMVRSPWTAGNSTVGGFPRSLFPEVAVAGSTRRFTPWTVTEIGRNRLSATGPNKAKNLRRKWKRTIRKSPSEGAPNYCFSRDRGLHAISSSRFSSLHARTGQNAKVTNKRGKEQQDFKNSIPNNNCGRHVNGRECHRVG